MKQPFSDETLTAYLDDELAREERDTLDAALAGDSLLQARLTSIELDKGQLRSSFDSLLPKAPTAPILAFPAPGPKRLSFPAAGMVAAACLCLGMLIGTTQFDKPAPSTGSDWKMAVAQYQLLYIPETLAMTNEATEKNLARLPELSDRLGRDLFPATRLQSIKFKRAQLLGLKQEPLVQMAYLSDREVPFAICVTKVTEADYAPVTEKIEGLSAAHWVRDGYGYIVIGGQDDSLVMQVVEEVERKI